ncbi:MAG: hypothetical protein WBW75_24490 [Mycobacterium sp.]|uniref:hypothetical protein n=1 Tax=Mycobacterium sp. TaxID=1785 RepID=UPI003C646FB0
MADHPENYTNNESFSDDDRWEAAELSVLIGIIDRQQEALERLAHDDPVGAVWFGSDDDWVDAHLKTRQQ